MCVRVIECVHECDRVGEEGSSKPKCRQRDWEETINLGDVLLSVPFSWGKWGRAQSSGSRLGGVKHGSLTGGEEVVLNAT